MSSGAFVPVNEPLLTGNEKKYLNACIDTGWISSDGPFVKELEQKVAAKVGRTYAVAVANGTAALDIAVAAIGLGPGDEVILPSHTIISCAAAIVRAGATPVVVDSDLTTWNMIPQQIAARVTPRTRAILIVHIYGLPVDMDPVLEIARKHDLKIIEDAAEVIGQTYRGKPCGSFGDISTFSFYPNKLITTGEGGMVLTDDPILAEKAASFRNLCFQASRRFVHEELGWNYRLSNLQAAVGLAQFERWDEFIAIKRGIGRRYSELLGDLEHITLPLAATPYAENIYWVYGLLLKESAGFDAAEAMRRLAAVGIGTRPFFWPMHEQPVFRRLGYFHKESHPGAETLARRGFYIPSGMALRPEQLERTAAAVKGLWSS
jgi:perosamine synthetase